MTWQSLSRGPWSFRDFSRYKSIVIDCFEELGNRIGAGLDEFSNWDESWFFDYWTGNVHLKFNLVDKNIYSHESIHQEVKTLKNKF